MRKDVKTRMRRRIEARLDELEMTGRELARAVGHDDAWISGLLKGSQGLQWKDFDAVADKLNLSPSELVRYDDTGLREVTPSEMRLLRHYQAWPQGMRDRWLGILDHFAQSVPDAETAVLLERLRAMPRSLRRPVLGWLFRLLEEGTLPAAAVGDAEPGSIVVPTETDAMRLIRSDQTQPGDRRRGTSRGQASVKPPHGTRGFR